MMKKRSMLLCLALVLSMTMAIGGTLAYLTDTETTTNVMTLGNVDIEIHEVQKTEDGNEVPFNQYQPLYPAVPAVANGEAAEGEAAAATEMIGELEKIVYVENVGESAAYVRTILAFPALNGKFVTLEDNSPIVVKYADYFTKDDIQVVHNVKIDNKDYTLFVFTYTAALAPDGKTEPSLVSFYMHPDVDNEDLAGFNGEYRVDAAAQAVQVNNFEGLGAKAALKAAFQDISADNHPWTQGLPAKPPVTVEKVEDLEEAINSGKPVALASDMVLEEPLAISGEADLDLNGKTLTIAADTNAFDIADGGELTISNGNVAVGDREDLGAIMVTNSTPDTTTTLNLENVTLTFGTNEEQVSTSIIAEAEEGNVVVNIGAGTVIEAAGQYSGPIVVGKNATVVMNDGVINASQTGAPNSGTSFEGVVLTEDSSVFTMNGGTINVEGTNSCDGIYAEYAGTVNFNGGTINVTASGAGYSIGIYATSGSVLNLNGGTINVMSPGTKDAEAIDVGSRTTVNYDPATSTLVVNLYKSIWEGNRVSEDDSINNIITGVEK